MVGEESGDDLPQPSSLFGNRLMQAPSQLLLNLSEFRARAVPSRCPLQKEFAAASLAADERESEKVEGLRFAKPMLGVRDRRKAAKLDQPCLFRMQRQCILLTVCASRPKSVGHRPHAGS